MTGILLKRLTTTLLYLLISQLGWSQFSFTPKRANIKFFHSDSTGWKITDVTGAKTVTHFNHSNAYVQVINGNVKVYTMSEGLWNTHPHPKFMDKIHIPHQDYQVSHDPSRFDSYTSFWISSKGGHIRVFKYRESTEVNNNGTLEKRTNKNVANHIFINGNKKAKISSKNTIFMIAPKGNIFEIDHNLKIWRFILTNRTLTPWTSDPPTQKMAFHIFKEENFKAVIPVGTKKEQYVFQVIDHKNKMGIATLSTDYFEITYNIPPIFDFISPSLNSEVHLVADRGRLGILEFIPQEDENEIPEFKTTYLSAKSEIHTGTPKDNNYQLMADGQIIPETKLSEKHTECDHHFGLIKIEDDLILYNESDPNGLFHQSGLYKISQTSWYISPNAYKITPYKNALLELNEANSSDPIYSVYSRSGRKLADQVTNQDGSKFFFLTSQVLNQEIDSMVLESSFSPTTYKIKSANKWGLVNIHMDTFKIIQPAKYLSIQSTGLPKSLVLTNDNSFDWLRMNTNKLELTSQKNPLLITENNQLTNEPKQAYSSAHFSQDLFFYNSNNQTKAEVFEASHVSPLFSSNYMAPYPGFIHSVNAENNHKLYTYKFKPLKTPEFDSVSLVMSNFTLLYLTNMGAKSISTNGKKIAAKKIVTAYQDKKPFKVISKYPEAYYYSDWFVVKEEGNWKIIDPSLINESEQKFPTLLEAFGTINTLK